MAIGGAALAGCGADDETNREAATVLVNADENNDRREKMLLLFSSNPLESLEDDDARNVVSGACVLDGCTSILLVVGRFVTHNPLLVSVAVNASPLATHINRHANAKRFLGTSKGSIIVTNWYNEIQCRGRNANNLCLRRRSHRSKICAHNQFRSESPPQSRRRMRSNPCT